ncbi:unnamed protein product [Auanema sp. JU1783]|nr:unnamed protein product [Auanema sp. JU1783]
MVQYTFYYFPARGRGEAIRHLLALSGKKWENRVIALEEWPSFKGSMPLGQIPVLEVDGVKIAQSVTILRFLGHQFHRAGKNAVECARLDMMAEVVQDLINAPFTSNYPRVLLGFPGFEHEDKHDYFKNKVLPELNQFAPIIEKFLVENGGNGVLIGDNETWVDVFAAETFSKFVDFGLKDALDCYPNIQQLISRVHSLQPIKHMIETRPPCPA